MVHKIALDLGRKALIQFGKWVLITLFLIVMGYSALVISKNVEDLSAVTTQTLKDIEGMHAKQPSP